MKLDLVNNIINGIKDSDIVQDFIKELSNYLEKELEKGVSKLASGNDIEQYRKEGVLYQVVDMSSNGVFLQNTNSNEIFEETELPQEIMDKIESDYVLRYQNGNYVIEEEITEDFMNSMIGISEYRKIKEDFAKNSNISSLPSDTSFCIKERDGEYSILTYDDNNTIQVPSALLPYFANSNTVLHYKNGAFEK